MKYFASSVILILLLQFISCNNSGSDNSTNPPDDNGQDISGCTDPEATNYNLQATVDDGSCEYSAADVFGCTDSNATNYNPLATVDDGSCDYGTTLVPGCTDPNATNYDPLATFDNGSCVYPPANVIGQETGIIYNQGSESAIMNYRLRNSGGTTAYNVQYRLKISYKCLTGFASQGFTTELLPSSSSLYFYGDIPAGQSINFSDSIQLCSGLGILTFNFEVYQVVWD